MLYDTFCLGLHYKDYRTDSLKNNGRYGYTYDFSVDYGGIDDILTFHKCLMLKKITSSCIFGKGLKHV